MFRTILILALFKLSIGHVIRSAEQGIVGGRNADIEDIPWHASISVKQNEAFLSHLGNGAILRPQIIITTASTLTNSADATLLDGSFFVRVGSVEATNGGTLIAVDRIAIHPQYNESRAANDIALLKLAKMLDFTSSIAPLLVNAVDRLRDGVNVTVSGWISQEPVSNSSRELQIVDQVIWNQDECAEAYSSADGGSLVADTHICAGSRANSGPCPVMLAEYQYIRHSQYFI